MTSIYTNRPLPPREVFFNGVLKRGFNYFQYLADIIPTGSRPVTSNHGMISDVADNLLSWEPVFNITGVPGVCKFLAVCAINTSGQDIEFGVRIVVNGANIFVNERIRVPGNEQSMLVPCGKMFIQNDYPCAVSSGQWTFDSALQVYIYRYDPAVEVLCLRNVHFTA